MEIRSRPPRHHCSGPLKTRHTTCTTVSQATPGREGGMTVFARESLDGKGDE